MILFFSFGGTKSFKQFETGSADNRRRKHLTIALHKDVMRKPGFYSRESRKPLRKSLDKLRARFKKRCWPPPALRAPTWASAGRQLERSFIESFIESVSRLVAVLGTPPGPKNRNEFAAKLLKYVPICFKRVLVLREGARRGTAWWGTVWQETAWCARLPAGHLNRLELLPSALLSKDSAGAGVQLHPCACWAGRAPRSSPGLRSSSATGVSHYMQNL